MPTMLHRLRTRPPKRGGLSGNSWVTFGVAALGAACFAWIVHQVVVGGHLLSWDASVAAFVVSVRSGALTRVLWAATLLGDSPLMATYLAAAVILLAAWGRWGDALVLAVGLGLGQVVSAVAKALIDRPRPPAPYALIERPLSASLPSGHAFMAVVTAVLAVSLLSRWAAGEGVRQDTLGADGPPVRRPSPWSRRRQLGALVVAAVVVGVVGASRVYLGVHWASDVLAGWSLGVAWGALTLGIAGGGARWLGRRWPGKTSRKPLARRARALIVAGLAMMVAGAAVAAGFLDPLR